MNNESVHEAREHKDKMDRGRWIKAQVAKAPPWTSDRIARVADALGYRVDAFGVQPEPPAGEVHADQTADQVGGGPDAG
jgi:hypothetical protein